MFELYKTSGSGNQRAFNRERRPLSCRDFLLGTFLCCEPSYYLVLFLCYEQVLTGVLPYDDGDYDDIFWGIKNGVRPSRPQNKWLQDSVWNVIAAGWRREPKERCALRTVYGVFVENAKTGESNAQKRKTLLAEMF